MKKSKVKCCKFKRKMVGKARKLVGRAKDRRIDTGGKYISSLHWDKRYFQGFTCIYVTECVFLFVHLGMKSTKSQCMPLQCQGLREGYNDNDFPIFRYLHNSYWNKYIVCFCKRDRVKNTY